MQMLLLFGSVTAAVAAATVAALTQTMERSKIFARLRRAILSTLAARVERRT